MTEPNKYFRNCNLIVEIAVVGFALATLSYKLDGAHQTEPNETKRTSDAKSDASRGRKV